MPFAAPVALGAGLLGGAASAGGSLMSAFAGASAARYQAQVEQQNAVLAKQAAGVALEQGDQDQQQQFRIGDAKMGMLRASLGANNIELNNGSAVLDQESQAQTTGQNVANAGYNANVRAVSELNQGQTDLTQAGIDKASASNDIMSGLISAGGSLLSSASTVSSKWDWMKGS